MENYMNNILNDIDELRNMIISSNEYKNYEHSLSMVEKDEELKKLIKEIISLQKKIVNLEHKKKEVNSLNKELDDKYSSLYSNKKYIDYIDSSKVLNNLLTDVQNRFNKYFNSLVS